VPFSVDPKARRPLLPIFILLAVAVVLMALPGIIGRSGPGR
jgi:hypothetical protein